MILQFLFLWEGVKLATKSKLAINFFLRNSKILHIEEPNMSDCMLKLLHKGILATWFVVCTEIEGDKIRPIH